MFTWLGQELVKSDHKEMDEQDKQSHLRIFKIC